MVGKLREFKILIKVFVKVMPNAIHTTYSPVWILCGHDDMEEMVGLVGIRNLVSLKLFSL